MMWNASQDTLLREEKQAQNCGCRTLSREKGRAYTCTYLRGQKLILRGKSENLVTMAVPLGRKIKGLGIQGWEKELFFHYTPFCTI